MKKVKNKHNKIKHLQNYPFPKNKTKHNFLLKSYKFYQNLSEIFQYGSSLCYGYHVCWLVAFNFSPSCRCSWHMSASSYTAATQWPLSFVSCCPVNLIWTWNPQINFTEANVQPLYSNNDYSPFIWPGLDLQPRPK